MLGAKLFLLPLCLLHVIISIESSGAQVAEKKAIVSGTPTTNLRAGAGVEHALKASLKDGDQVTVEKLEGEWYQVTAAADQAGYIQKNLLKLTGEAPSTPAGAAAVAVKAVAAETKELTKEKTATATAQRPKPSAPAKSLAAAATPEEPKTAPGKSPSILQMLEGHENELMIAAAIAAAAFFMGWICGGYYYLRRDRARRTKLRF